MAFPGPTDISPDTSAEALTRKLRVHRGPGGVGCSADGRSPYTLAEIVAGGFITFLVCRYYYRRAGEEVECAGG